MSKYVCAIGLLGVCQAGTEMCQDGSIVCAQNVQPSAETCNGLDDDCDGVYALALSNFD